MTPQQELAQALRALLDDRDNPLPRRELDPVQYIVKASDRAERDGTDLSPADKELAYKLFIEGVFTGPIRASVDGDE